MLNRIGSEVYYLENNEIVYSRVVAAFLQTRTDGSEEIILELADGKRMAEQEACFGLEALFKQLNFDFRRKEAQANRDKVLGVRPADDHATA